MGERQEENAEKATMSVRECARILNINPNLAYESVKLGKIPSLKFGRAIRIPKAALEKLLQEGGFERLK